MGSGPEIVDDRGALNWIFRIGHRLTHGLWFRPSLVALAFLVLGIVLPAVERSGLLGEAPLDAGSPDTARALLATIAGSLITVLALVFSLTLVAMQLVSTQLTPRALRGFLAERMTQLAAGVFVGTALYAFIVMGYVDGGANGAAGVPRIAVLVGVVLGVLAMALLLVFVNHIASWMQLANISWRIFDATSRTIDRHFRASFDAPPRERETPDAASGFTVVAERAGFVQYFATRHDGRLAVDDDVRTIELLVAAGDFVDVGDPLLVVWPPEARDDDVTELAVIGVERDLEQDVVFGLRQLADIALRALSPGINDPTTACVCINYLEALLASLGRRRLTPTYADDDRALAAELSFERVLEVAFEEIVVFGAAQPRVMRALDDRLVRLANHLARRGVADRAEVVRSFRARVVAHAAEQAPTPYDAERLRARLGEAPR